MSPKRPVLLVSALLICLAAILIAQPVIACSVCYGDPNSAMTKGVEAGVLVLLGVVGGVLMLVASLLLFWVRRAANLEDAEMKALNPVETRLQELVNS